MEYAFQYATQPFDHQRASFESTRDYQYYAYFWEMGTGKSKVMIDTAQWLFVNERIDSMIVTAEKGYYMNWVLNEFPTHWPAHIPVRIIPYTSYLTAENKRNLETLLTPIPGVLDVLVINIEAMSGLSMNGAVFAEKFRSAHESTLMVIDESTTIKSMTAARTKVAIRIGHKCQYRRILTGTPITQSPLDLYAQCEFLKHQLLGFGSFSSFRSFYSIMAPVTVGPNRQIIQTVGFRELDDLSRRVQPFSSRLLKKDCLTLPEKVYTPIYIDPTPDQLSHIRRLKQEAMTLVEQGLVTAENALTILTKSLQIAGGHLKDDDGRVHRIDCGKAKRLTELVREIPEGKKIIVWGYFREDMQVIHEALSEVCPVYEVSGRVDQEQRERNIESFRKNEGKCVFLASPRVAGKSLTLVEAEYSIYYSNGFNLEHRLQSEDRNHRIGQKNSVTYFDLICLETPDLKVVRALRAKEVLSRSVLDKLVAFFEP